MPKVGLRIYSQDYVISSRFQVVSVRHCTHLFKNIVLVLLEDFTLGRLFQQVLNSQLPETPWHRHFIIIRRAMACGLL